MKICVCVKQVPDSWAEKKLTASDSTLDRAAADRVVNELDEYAVEEALRIVEAGEGEVTILSMGPDEAADSVRKAISMGAHAGIHISDPALHGSDALATSLVLAKALEGRGFDLIMFGSESTDARMSVVPAMLAERLNAAQLTFASKVDVDPAAGKVSITRVTEAGVDEMHAQFPCVISVVEKINEPRYPSFKGIMAAKKKTIESRDLATVGVSAEGAWSLVADATPRPARAAGIKVTDDGTGGEQLVSFLAEKKLI